MIRIDLITKVPYGKELRETIIRKNVENSHTPRKEMINDKGLNYISRRISVQEGDKLEMIENYLAKVLNKLIKMVEQNSDTSMKSITSEEAENTEDVLDSQPLPSAHILTNAELEQTEALLSQLKKKGKDKK